MKTISRKRRRKLSRQWWRRVHTIPIASLDEYFIKFYDHLAGRFSRTIGLRRRFRCKQILREKLVQFVSKKPV